MSHSKDAPGSEGTALSGENDTYAIFNATGDNVEDGILTQDSTNSSIVLPEDPVDYAYPTLSFGGAQYAAGIVGDDNNIRLCAGNTQALQITSTAVISQKNHSFNGNATMVGTTLSWSGKAVLDGATQVSTPRTQYLPDIAGQNVVAAKVTSTLSADNTILSAQPTLHAITSDTATSTDRTFGINATTTGIAGDPLAQAGKEIAIIYTWGSNVQAEIIDATNNMQTIGGATITFNSGGSSSGKEYVRFMFDGTDWIQITALTDIA